MPPADMGKLYLDIDGVLLGKDNAHDAKVVLARHAREFLAYCTSQYNCFWLTTHARQRETANIEGIFKLYADDDVMKLIRMSISGVNICPNLSVSKVDTLNVFLNSLVPYSSPIWDCP